MTCSPPISRQPVDVRSVLEAEVAPFMAAANDIQINATTCAWRRRCGEPDPDHPRTGHQRGEVRRPVRAGLGRLRIVCERTQIGQARLTWSETSSRPVNEGAEVKGFGTRLMQRLTRDLGGEAEIGLRRTGFEAQLCFRAAAGEARSDAGAPTPRPRFRLGLNASGRDRWLVPGPATACGADVRAADA